MLNQPHTFPVFIASLWFILTICHFILFCVVKTKLRDLRSINNWVDIKLSILVENQPIFILLLQPWRLYRELMLFSPVVRQQSESGDCRGSSSLLLTEKQVILMLKLKYFEQLLPLETKDKQIFFYKRSHMTH